MNNIDIQKVLFHHENVNDCQDVLCVQMFYNKSCMHVVFVYHVVWNAFPKKTH